jgi:hypothetical protein
VSQEDFTSLETRVARLEATISTLALLLASHVGAMVVMTDKEEIPTFKKVDES